MATLFEIVAYLDDKFNISSTADSALNGLQVEGQDEVEKIVVAVDASIEAVEKAVEAKAQMLIVHHGLFWGKPVPIVGAMRHLLNVCLENRLSLYAMHLPLDADPEVGNNFMLSRILDLGGIEPAFLHRSMLIGCTAINYKQRSLNEVTDILKSLPGGFAPLCLPFGPEVPVKVGVVSGAAAEHLTECPQLEVDTFITGEPRQFAYHFAKENKINVIFAGHYATETVGVITLASHLEQKFGVEQGFIDIPTGI